MTWFLTVREPVRFLCRSDLFVRLLFSTYVPANHTCNATIALSDPCWAGWDLTRWDAYRIFLVSRY